MVVSCHGGGELNRSSARTASVLNSEPSLQPHLYVVVRIKVSLYKMSSAMLLVCLLVCMYMCTHTHTHTHTQYVCVLEVGGQRLTLSLLLSILL